MAGDNPFATDDSLGLRISDLPGEILSAPIKLLRTILQTPIARADAAARGQQLDLGTQVVGSAPEGNASGLLNDLTFGLVPDTETGRINQDNLNPAQQDRFNNLSDLQQQIVQARSPEDFASLITNDQFFQDNQPVSNLGGIALDEGRNVGGGLLDGATATAQLEPVVKLKPGEVGTRGGKVDVKNPNKRLAPSGSALIDEETGTFGSRNQGPIVVAPGASVLPAAGGDFKTAPEDFTLNPDAIRFDQDRNEIARGVESPIVLSKDQKMVQADGTFIADNRLTVEQRLDITSLIESGHATIESINEASKASGGLSLDLSKIRPDLAILNESMNVARIKSESGGFKDQQSLRKEYDQKLKPYVNLADSFRRFAGAAGFDKGSMPPDLARYLVDSGIDLDRIAAMDSNGIRDVAMVFGFMKALDPLSTVREGEAAMVSAARAFGFAAGPIAKLLEGEGISNTQRKQIFDTIKDIFRTNMRGYVITRLTYLKIARAGGFPVDTTVPDPVPDLAPFMNRTLGASSTPEQQFGFMEEEFQKFTGDSPDSDPVGFADYANVVFGLDVTQPAVQNQR